MPDPIPSAWTDQELQVIADMITVTLAWRQFASTEKLAVLVDGRARYRFSPRNTPSISFDLDRGEKLIEVVSEEAGVELPLAAYLMDYDEECYERKWGLWGERRQKTIVILEGGQKVSFIVSLRRRIEREGAGARVKVCFRPRSLLYRAVQWWESFQIWS